MGLFKKVEDNKKTNFNVTSKGNVLPQTIKVDDIRLYAVEKTYNNTPYIQYILSSNILTKRVKNVKDHYTVLIMSGEERGFEYKDIRPYWEFNNYKYSNLPLDYIVNKDERNNGVVKTEDLLARLNSINEEIKKEVYEYVNGNTSEQSF